MDLLVAPRNADRLRDALVVDVRDREGYLQGHWPGAVHLDVRRWEALARTAEADLRKADVWHEEIGRLGIDGSRSVVVYDDGRMTEAARAWFILQLFGVRAALLNGGWPALKLQLSEPARGETSPEARQYTNPTGIRPVVDLITRDELAMKLPVVQVLDARTAAEHSGMDLRSNPRGGHLPGAISLPHSHLLSEEGLKDGSELASMLSDAGFSHDQPLVSHCDAGARGALAAFAAVLAGHRRVGAYYLSFSDWAREESCPVVRTGTGEPGPL